MMGCIVLGGIYAADEDGLPQFHRLPDSQDARQSELKIRLDF